MSKQQLIKVTFDTETKGMEIEINSKFMPMVTYAHKLVELEIDETITAAKIQKEVEKEAKKPTIIRPDLLKGFNA